MNRLSVFILATCVALVAMSGCSKPSKTTLVIYSPHGKDLLEFCTGAFAAAHPEIEVQWLDMGSQDCLDRLRSERTNPQADIWWGAPASLFSTAESEGLLQPYAPTWKNVVSAETHSPTDGWYGTYLTPEVIAYNTSVLTAETAPHDWNDLLAPYWKNRIVVREPLASGTMRTIFSSIIQREARRTGSVDSGFAWLRALDANTKTYCADQTQLYLKLSRGEADVTVWNMPDIMLQATVHHYPFGYVVPTSGTPVLTDGIALVRGSVHADAAKMYYEFVTSSAMAAAAAQRFYRVPARNDIDSNALPIWMRVPIPRMAVDWQDLAAHEQEWMKRWSESVKASSTRNP